MTNEPTGLVSQSLKLLDEVIADGDNLSTTQCLRLGQVISNLKMIRTLGKQTIDAIQKELRRS